MWVPIGFFAMLYCSSQEKMVVSAEKKTQDEQPQVPCWSSSVMLGGA